MNEYQLPNLNLIFAHARLEQNDEFIELMKQYPATSEDISKQTATNIGKMIYKLGDHRLMFGSEYPFFNQAFPILSVLKATQNKEIKQMIFADNAKRVLGFSR